MPYQQSYADAYGTTHSSSYWLPAVINIDYANSRAHVVYYGYKDYSAFSGGKQPIGQKAYTATGSAFTTYYGHTALGSATPAESADVQALATLDQTGGVSFFATATEVDNSGNPV